jgi:hypothetical protein
MKCDECANFKAKEKSPRWMLWCEYFHHGPCPNPCPYRGTLCYVYIEDGKVVG